ncbi:MAG: hypothetical protein ACOX6O_09690 [Christensenellales bacterium]|jgi:ABC-2 type transport system permease protein
MIRSLFVYEWRQLLRRLAGFAVLALLLGLGAVFLFTPDMQGHLRYLSEELPLVAQLAGYAGSTNLPVHVMGVLYGFILSLVMVLAGMSLARRLITRPAQDGRMAQRLAAPHRRGAIFFTLFWLMALEMLIISMGAFLGQTAGVLIFLGGQGDIPALLRLALGMAFSALPVAGAMAAVASLAPGPVSARRLSRLIGIAFIGFMMVSRLAGWPQYLRFFTPFALFKGQALLSGFEATSLLGLPLSVMLAGLGAWGFSGRDL